MGDVVEALDLHEARTLLKAALDKVDEIDGRNLPHPERTRDRSAALAAVAKDLLFLAHCCDKARVLVMDEYQLTRGFTTHLT